MLNFIYYPISWILWFWHKAWGLVLDPDAGITWALSIIFLVVTIRLVLLKPMINQLRSGRKMQEMQPRMQEIKRKYANDQQAQALEMRKLQKEMGVNPLASCLPMLVQIPIFIGLFHVLRSFNRTGGGTGQLGMTIEETRNTPNYGFDVAQVQSFLDARLFGAPLSSYISMDSDMYGAFSPTGDVDFSRGNIIAVVVPMMVIAAVIMHFNAKHSMARQARKKAEQPKKKGAATPQQDMMETQMAMMQKLMVWVMPVLSLLGAFLWHVGLAVYMLTNTTWTFVQQILVYRKMDREEEEEKEAKIAAKRTNAPKPGKKPTVHGQETAPTATAVLEHEDDKDAQAAPAAQDAPAGPPLSAEQVKTYRSEAAAMGPEKLDALIAEIEEQLTDPATKKKAKKEKRLAVLRQFRDEQQGS
ncbi:membrane protein insertase YidC [Corynebacterium terpenotabidum]|uniref:Membrane protein insertase YidC n=1 Tax=Corynebacterium terpenotabidum Y-11 TaxID=1200352 RepID=S4XHH0_9CORY|nr:membrane protein insertase YidC [Corynebacterium terpenotabidum]AGP32024.1 putative inner membrane protein translocase component YidC [Corynebacterium terpenotabidum Y-11]